MSIDGVKVSGARTPVGKACCGAFNDPHGGGQLDAKRLHRELKWHIQG